MTGVVYDTDGEALVNLRSELGVGAIATATWNLSAASFNVNEKLAPEARQAGAFGRCGVDQQWHCL